MTISGTSVTESPRRNTLRLVGASPDPVRGYAPGIWDMFHIGHLNLLERARSNCDRLIVGVVPDETAYAIQGWYPIVPLAERVAIVAAIGVVDEVVVDYAVEKLEVWQRVGFDVLFSGDDAKGTSRGRRLEEEMASVGVQVHYFPYTRQSVPAVRPEVRARS